MGLLVKQDGERTKLQEKITAELREKMMKTADIDNELPDLVEDSAYQEGTKRTSTDYLYIVILILAAVGALVAFLVI